MMKRKTFTLIALGVLVAATSTLSAKTKVIAHRGYWKTDGSAQNSLTSLRKANAIKTYGSELDVWLSTDGVPVVTHDRTITPNKLVIEYTPYAVLKGIKLSNGETVPSLQEYLTVAKQCQDTKLIIELKSHSTPEKETRLAEKVVEMVKINGLENKAEYIAFSLHMTKELIRLAPKADVFYLNGDLSPQELKAIGCAGLDYHLGVMQKNENWFKEAHELGLKVNIWTVNTREDMQYCIDKGADFITTDQPELLQEVLKDN